MCMDIEIDKYKSCLPQSCKITESLNLQCTETILQLLALVKKVGIRSRRLEPFSSSSSPFF